MSAAHTRGPWRYSFGLSWPIVQMGIEGGFYVAGTTKEQAEADARLIAAAPDLLEAAKASVNYDKAIQVCADSPEKMASFCTAEGDDLDTLYALWISKSRAAIEKATGGQP